MTVVSCHSNADVRFH